jgi:hypothetical protein
MVFSRRTAAPIHQVMSDVDLNEALSYLNRTAGTWFDGTPESVRARLSTVARTIQINTHLMKNAEFRGDDIAFYATVDEKMRGAASELGNALLAANEREDSELPEFEVNAAENPEDLDDNGDYKEWAND